MLEKYSKEQKPYYRIDLADIDYNIEMLERAFGVKRNAFCYSMKANDHPYVLEYMKQQGLGIEVSSAVELAYARSRNFECIVYEGPLISLQKDTDVWCDQRILFVVRTLDDLKFIMTRPLRQCFIALRICVRFLPLEKHGLLLDEIPIAIQMLQNHAHIKIKALHFHAGGYGANLSTYRYAFNRLERAVKLLRTKNLASSITHINIGGGIRAGKKFRRSFAERLFYQLQVKYWWAQVCLHFFEKHRLKAGYASLEKDITSLGAYAQKRLHGLRKLMDSSLQLKLEPGTVLINDAVTLFAPVIERQKKKVSILATRRTEYGWHAFDHTIVNVTNPANDIQNEIVCGALASADDYFSSCYRGKQLALGDYVAIEGMGAYTMSTHTAFVFPLPAVVIMRGDEIIHSIEEKSEEERYDISCI